MLRTVALATFVLASACCGPVLAQIPGGGVGQSGSVTANDCAAWVGNGLIKDSGAACGGGGGSGTVTSVSVVTANGISGSVANPTTTPAITLTLGAITPSSVAINGCTIGSNIFCAGGTGGTSIYFDPTNNIAFFNLGASSTANFKLNYNAAAPATIPHENSIQISGADNNFAGIYIDSYGSSGGTNYRAFENLRAARGTGTSPTAIQQWDEIARWSARAYGTTAFTNSLGSLSIVAAQNISDTAQGAFACIRTTALNTTGGGSSTTPPCVVGFTPSGGLVVGPSFFTYNTNTNTQLVFDPGAGAINASASVTIGAGSAITSSGAGGALGTAAFANTGTSGATIPLNNGGFTQSGTANFTSTFQINSNTITWPAAAISVARIDAGQTFIGNQIFQASGATGGNAAVSIGVSTSTSGLESLGLSNDTSLGTSTNRLNNSATANTTLVNVPNAYVVSNNGASAGGLFLGTGSNSAPIVFFTGGTATATNAAMAISGTGQGVTVGSATPATGQRGDLAQIKETDAAAAPGAGYAVLKWVAGSAGSCNLIAYAGTSATPVTIASTVGAGC